MQLNDTGRTPKTSFGWSHLMHRSITEKIAGKYNKLLPYSEGLNVIRLKQSCIEPDFSRKQITSYISGHFADIDNRSTDPPDAFELVKIYSNKALKANEKKNYDKRDDYLGYAIHFLQDMMNPKHVVFKDFPKGSAGRQDHIDFENMAEAIRTLVLKAPKPETKNQFEPFFDTALPSAMRETKNLFKGLKNKNPQNITNILISSIQNTYNMTDRYIKTMIDLFNEGKSKISIKNPSSFDAA